MAEPKKQSQRSKRWRAGVSSLLGLALIVMAVALRAWDPAALEVLRLKTFDLYQIAAPRVADDRPVVIVDIDERSLREHGQWPWPRTRVADLVDKLDDLGASAIAFDIIFAENDQMSPDRVMRQLPGIDAALAERIRRLPSNDEVFAGALQRAPTIMAQSGVRDDAIVADHGPRTQISRLTIDPTDQLTQFPKLLRNLPILEAGASGFGLISIVPEIDGVVRRVPLIATVQGEMKPSLSVELLRVVRDEKSLVVGAASDQRLVVLVGDLALPTDREGQVWVHFAPFDTARYVSAADILDGTVDPARIADKAVLIGTSAIGLFDIKSTPLNAATPGVEIHAQLVEMILTGEQLVRPDYADGVEVVMALLVGLVIVALVPRLGALSVLWLGMAIGVGLLGGSWWLFTQERVLIDVVYPLLSSLGVWGVLAFYNYSQEEQERSWVRSAFGRYLAPDVVEQLAEDREGLSLGGETRILTLLFTDVRGFTPIAETFADDPQGLTRLLNSFLTPLSNAIVDRGGTIDKYMGDAIMAFWNAPLDVEDHGVKACEAALEMQERIDALNAARRAAAPAGAHVIPIDVGVGVNTGECVVGNMGSELRFDYSAIGDPVNLASRIEGATRHYGVKTLIGASTAALCGDRMAYIALDRIRVKGKLQPETVYALLGRADRARDPSFKALRDQVGVQMDRYWAQDWDGALDAAKTARRMDHRGELAAFFDVMEQRIADFRTSPPAADWDGVWVATVK